MFELSDLINRVNDAKNLNHQSLLTQALTELNEVVGRNEIKTIISTQVLNIISNGQNIPINLNTVLYGSHGTGKTLISTILAKIWYSLSSSSREETDIMTVVSRADFVDKDPESTKIKTNRLLESNIGKVLVVEEANLLLKGPHDESGLSALTTLNLFPNRDDIIIILVVDGMQNVLLRYFDKQFRLQFTLSDYTPEQLFEIFKQQLVQRFWRLSDESATLCIFMNNYRKLSYQGYDTKRLVFFAELRHSQDFFSDEDVQDNVLDPSHITAGFLKLCDSN